MQWIIFLFCSFKHKFPLLAVLSVTSQSHVRMCPVCLCSQFNYWNEPNFILTTLNFCDSLCVSPAQLEVAVRIPLRPRSDPPLPHEPSLERSRGQRPRCETLCFHQVQRWHESRDGLLTDCGLTGHRQDRSEQMCCDGQPAEEVDYQVSFALISGQDFQEKSCIFSQ